MKQKNTVAGGKLATAADGKVAAWGDDSNYTQCSIDSQTGQAVGFEQSRELSSQSGAIIRTSKNKNYFVASNEPFNDRKLSWEAAGVMGYLLSKPDDWEVSEENLINFREAGKHVVKRIIRELKSAGYLHRYQERRQDGTWTTISIVYESPALNPHFAGTRKSGSGLTDTRLTAIRLTDTRLTDTRLTDTRLTDSGKSVFKQRTDSPSTDSPSTDSPSTDSSCMAAAEFLTWIDEPKRSELLGLASTTDSLAMVWDTWFRQGDFGKILNPIGFAVHQIENGLYPPKRTEKKSPDPLPQPEGHPPIPGAQWNGHAWT